MTDHPQDLIDAVEDVIEYAYNHSEPWRDTASIAAIKAVRSYDVAHSTPAPDVSDEALAQIIQFPIDSPYVSRADLWNAMRSEDKGIAIIRSVAVRHALASSSAAVDVPENINRIHGARMDGKWRVTLDNFTDPIPSSLDGTGSTLQDAVGDALNQPEDGGQ